MSNTTLEEMKLSELRELYPEIKSNSQKGFIKKLRKTKPELFNQVTIDEALGEISEEFEMPVDKDAVREVEAEVPQTVAEDVPIVETVPAPEASVVGVKFEMVLEMLDAAMGNVTKILLKMPSSNERRFVYDFLKRRYNTDTYRMKVFQDAAMEFHLQGKTFVKCVCPNRYDIELSKRKYDVILEVV